jgi:LysM repeat protein
VSKPAAKPDAPAPAPKPTYYTVSQGDTLSRIARKNGTTPEVLAKLNGLKDVGLIRPGQKLKLPQAPAPAAASKPIPNAPLTKTSEKVESTPSTLGGSHTVKDGETFFGIARKYGLSVETLGEANPNVNPRAIRIGQSLKLVPRNSDSGRSVASSPPAPKSTAALSSSASPTSEPVSNQPKIRSIRVDKEINFGDFAAAHGMEPAKLNALNGLHLEPNTVLAKGSELYVSAQP